MNEQTTTKEQNPTSANKKVGLFTDDHGNRSIMRLMSFFALIAGIWFGWMTITDTNTTSLEGVYITTAFLLAAFAPKALQKYIENSYPLKR